MSDLAAFIAKVRALRAMTQDRFREAIGESALAHWPTFSHNPANWLVHIHAERPDWAAAVWIAASPPEFSDG